MPEALPDFGVQTLAHTSGQVAFHWLGHAPNPGFPLKADELPGVTTMGCWETRDPQAQLVNKPFPLREIQVTLVEDGRRMTLEDMAGHTWPMTRPTLFCSLPWQGYAYPFSRSNGSWVNLDVGVTRPNQAWAWPAWVVLRPADRSELAWRWRQMKSPLLAPTPAILETFARLGEAVKAHESGRQNTLSWITVLLNALLWDLLQVLRDQPGLAAAAPEGMDSRNRQTVRLFWEELGRRPESLAQGHAVPRMAKACGMCVATFIALTRAATGETPANLILSRRLALAAKQLRLHPERAIADVAGDCGFSSGQYFATRFGKKYGCTPKAWRQKNGGP